MKLIITSTDHACLLSILHYVTPTQMAGSIPYCLLYKVLPSTFSTITTFAKQLKEACKEGGNQKVNQRRKIVMRRTEVAPNVVQLLSEEAEAEISLTIGRRAGIILKGIRKCERLWAS